MNLYENVRVRVKLRSEYEGRPIKPSAASLEGRKLRLCVAWLMDEDDSYPGEYALTGSDDESLKALREADIAWIASGDVEVLP